MIEELKKMPQDAEVFCEGSATHYTGRDEELRYVEVQQRYGKERVVVSA